MPLRHQAQQDDRQRQHRDLADHRTSSSNETIWLMVPKSAALDSVPEMTAAPPVITVMNALAM